MKTERLTSRKDAAGVWHAHYPSASRTLCGLLLGEARGSRGRPGKPTCEVCAEAASEFDRIDRRDEARAA